MTTDNSSVWSTASAQQFVESLAAIDDVQILRNFLRDVLTEKEIIEVSSRLEAARLLNDGSKYTDIVNKTKLSSRTVARISDWMQNGCGGYAIILERISKSHDHTPPASAA